MQMKISISHIPLAALAATLLAGLGCQTAKKPAASLTLPKQAPPPPIQTRSAPPAHVSALRGQAETQKPAPAPSAQPAAQTAVQAEAKSDPVQELVTKAEAEYKAGLDLSIAGQTDQAKDHFDRAFGILLNSPAGI